MCSEVPLLCKAAHNLRCVSVVLEANNFLVLLPIFVSCWHELLRVGNDHSYYKINLLAQKLPAMVLKTSLESASAILRAATESLRSAGRWWGTAVTRPAVSVVNALAFEGADQDPYRYGKAPQLGFGGGGNFRQAVWYKQSVCVRIQIVKTKEDGHWFWVPWNQILLSMKDVAYIAVCARRSKDQADCEIESEYKSNSSKQNTDLGVQQYSPVKFKELFCCSAKAQKVCVII